MQRFWDQCVAGRLSAAPRWVFLEMPQIFASVFHICLANPVAILRVTEVLLYTRGYYSAFHSEAEKAHGGPEPLVQFGRATARQTLFAEDLQNLMTGFVSHSWPPHLTTHFSLPYPLTGTESLWVQSGSGSVCLSSQPSPVGLFQD